MKWYIIILFLLFIPIVNSQSVSSIEEIKTECGLFDCYTEIEIPISIIDKVTINKLEVKTGNITFTEIIKKDVDRLVIHGKIEGSTNNYWGIKDYWNSTWWNSSYPYRYEVNSKADILNMLLAINDTYGINQDVIWSNNATTNESVYLYCVLENCTTAYEIANRTERKFYQYENLTGNEGMNIYDDDYILVYHMNKSDRVIDATGNCIGNNCSVDVELQGVSTVLQVKGIFGNATDLNPESGGSGGNAYFYIANSTGLVDGEITAFTIEAWTNFTNSGDEQILFYDYTSDGTFYLRFERTQRLNCFIYSNNGTSYNLYNNTPTFFNTWYYVACSWNGTHAKTYVNGVLQQTLAVPDINNTFTAGVFISRDLGGNQGLNASFDEFRFSKIARSDDYFKFQYWNGINNLTSSGEVEPFNVTTTTTTIPYQIEDIDYCELLWVEQNAQVVENDNWCIDNSTLAFNITYRLTVDTNQSVINTYVTESCQYDCDNVTKACREPPYIEYGNYFIIVIAIIIGILVITYLGKRV